MKLSFLIIYYLFIDFVRRNVPGTFRGVGVLLLDVSVKMEIIDVKMEIIDFLKPRIKQKLRETKYHTRKMCNRC